jgi:hypothetical protein
MRLTDEESAMLADELGDVRRKLRTTLGSQIEAFISLWPNRELECRLHDPIVAHASSMSMIFA